MAESKRKTPARDEFINYVDTCLDRIEKGVVAEEFFDMLRIAHSLFESAVRERRRSR